MFLFRLKHIVRLGAKSLWMHRLRSILTTLGIVFGVCSVIAMLAIGEGASQAAQQAIAQLGSTNLIVETVRPPEEKTDTGGGQFIDEYGLTYDDAESIRNTIPDVQVVVPIREIDQKARYLTRPEVAIKIIGTIPWYTEISPVRVSRGRFLSSVDLQYRLAVCVIDDQVARKLFAFDDPLGLDVKIHGSYYRVVGIASPPAPAHTTASFGTNPPAAGETSGVVGSVYIPLTTTRCRFPEISARFTGGSSSREKVELQKITVKADSSEQVLPLRDILDALLDRLHEKQDYQIVVPLEQLRAMARLKRIYSVVLGSIAAISLLVGGIGIMNIMLATVSERTREIGIRRALGARKRDIIVQFLSETLLLTLAGGAIGIILGSLIPSLVTYFGNMPTVITGGSLVLAFGISAAVGITFGLYPAYRAANMDPIESLRHE
ncbi:MAG: ABC transporter permease [Planctomycetota bacterium]|nr:MAG: ABC transporter permease [Planctomycetota bacterium]